MEKEDKIRDYIKKREIVFKDEQNRNNTRPDTKQEQQLQNNKDWGTRFVNKDKAS